MADAFGFWNGIGVLGYTNQTNGVLAEGVDMARARVRAPCFVPLLTMPASW